MKFVIQSEQDLRFLQGKWILQVNSKDPDMKLQDFSWEFAKEKRLFLVADTQLVCLFGQITKKRTYDEFVRYFNSYLFTHDPEDKTCGGRFHRLLTSSELDYLNTKMKERNY